MFVSDEQNNEQDNEQDNDSGCKNFVPSVCESYRTKFPSMDKACDYLANRAVACEYTWRSSNSCGKEINPETLIKDDCKVSCNNCKGKHLILFANLQILLF